MQLLITQDIHYFIFPTCVIWIEIFPGKNVCGQLHAFLISSLVSRCIICVLTSSQVIRYLYRGASSQLHHSQTHLYFNPTAARLQSENTYKECVSQYFYDGICSNSLHTELLVKALGTESIAKELLSRIMRMTHHINV